MCGGDETGATEARGICKQRGSASPFLVVRGRVVHLRRGGWRFSPEDCPRVQEADSCSALSPDTAARGMSPALPRFHPPISCCP